jgi:hypothetical protein
MYWVYCPQCGWKSLIPVEWRVVEEMLTDAGGCRDCREAKRPFSPLKYYESTRYFFGSR